MTRQQRLNDLSRRIRWLVEQAVNEDLPAGLRDRYAAEIPHVQDELFLLREVETYQ